MTAQMGLATKFSVQYSSTSFSQIRGLINCVTSHCLSTAEKLRDAKNSIDVRLFLSRRIKIDITQFLCCRYYFRCSPLGL